MSLYHGNGAYVSACSDSDQQDSLMDAPDRFSRNKK